MAEIIENSALQALLDKQSIHELLVGYCRGIDRRDADLLRRVYWPEAIDDHAFFKGNIEEFIQYSFPALEGATTQHQLMNVWIELTGSDSAFSESYVSAFHEFPEKDGVRLERTVGGRYLDKHQKRENEWRISARTLVIDWYQVRPANSIWDSGRYAGLENRGTTKPNDPIYLLHPNLKNEVV